jgi:hypothetical protein
VNRGRRACAPPSSRASVDGFGRVSPVSMSVAH